MTNYIATIRHHSISRAREIMISGSLTQAKRAASREFGAEQRDYYISIYEPVGHGMHELVSRKLVGTRKWQDRT